VGEKSEKTAGHDLRSEDGRKLRVEGFEAEDFKIL